MKKPIEKSEFAGHLQRLRHIFDRWVECQHGDALQFSAIVNRNGQTFLSLQRNASTIDVNNDHDRDEVCAVFLRLSQKRVLLAYSETWRNEKSDRKQFDKASLTFFLEFGTEALPNTKQLFRLEWENWQIHEQPNKAAYPHWQFDRWLTGSDTRLVEELRANFEREQDEEIIFESAAQQAPASRPDLSWFTKVHFPAIAPWATHPITALDDVIQSHRSVPSSAEEIEHWVESALCYLKNELTSHALFG